MDKGRIPEKCGKVIAMGIWDPIQLARRTTANNVTRDDETCSYRTLTDGYYVVYFIERLVVGGLTWCYETRIGWLLHYM